LGHRTSKTTKEPLIAESEIALYRARAEELRQKAKQTSWPDLYERVLWPAEQYELLTDSLEPRPLGKSGLALGPRVNPVPTGANPACEVDIPPPPAATPRHSPIEAPKINIQDEPFPDLDGEGA